MQPANETDYKSLFSQLIKKQMLVLGPDITLAKVRNVTGLTVDINGDVQKIEGDPQVMLQSLINQFVELSGMIVKKTMESILTSYPGMMAMAATGVLGGVQATAQSVPAAPTQQAVTAQPATVQVSEPAQSTIPEAQKDESEIPTAPLEPPPMTAVKLDSLVTPSSQHQETPKPDSFTDADMASLNKALEDLSKAPIASEKG